MHLKPVKKTLLLLLLLQHPDLERHMSRHGSTAEDAEHCQSIFIFSDVKYLSIFLRTLPGKNVVFLFC